MFENDLSFYDDKEKIESVKLNRPNEFICFSLNKKKRWLLSDLLKSAAQIDFKYTKKISQNEKLEENSQKKKHKAYEDEANYGFMVYTIDSKYANKGFQYQQNQKSIINIFDNNGLEINNAYISIGAFEQNLYNKTTKRSRVKKDNRSATKSKFKRPVFKNGNRDRNSGIIKRFRQQTNSKHDSETKADPFYENIKAKYYFIKPKDILKTKKSWCSGNRKIIQRFDNEYRKSWEINEYMNNRITNNRRCMKYELIESIQLNKRETETDITVPIDVYISVDEATWLILVSFERESALVVVPFGV